jgi:hypothetical protein
MFENKRLDEIEQKIESLRMAIYGTAYGGGMSEAILALIKDVAKLKSETKSDKLLPCPVCGDAPEVIQTACVNVTRHRISCIKPRHSITTYGMTYKEAAEDWNRRNI